MYGADPYSHGAPYSSHFVYIMNSSQIFGLNLQQQNRQLTYHWAHTQCRVITNRHIRYPISIFVRFQAHLVRFWVVRIFGHSPVHCILVASPSLITSSHVPLHCSDCQHPIFVQLAYSPSFLLVFIVLSPLMLFSILIFCTFPNVILHTNILHFP